VKEKEKKHDERLKKPTEHIAERTAREMQKSQYKNGKRLIKQKTNKTLQIKLVKHSCRM